MFLTLAYISHNNYTKAKGDLEMSTARLDHLGYSRVIQDLVIPARLVTTTEADPRQRDVARALRITGILQTTLDVHKVIEIFATEVNKVILHDGVLYRCAPRGLEHTLGTQEINAVTYRLAITEESLGEITFSRAKRFTARETATLEYLLCGLVYPLRNALAYESALQAATKDSLTGVHNRNAMDSTLAREVDLAHRHSNPLALLIADIDYFKRVNDTYGHSTGDEVIRSVATAIKASVRSSDIVFRYGGEEFMVLLSNTHKKGALLLAERIRRKVELSTLTCLDKPVPATISLGVAWLELSDTDSSLFEKADAALYAAKTAGRNCVKGQLTT